MYVRDITSYLEEFAPLSFQEDYDNSGLIIGSPEWLVRAVLLAVDVTEAVVNEAIEVGANMIVAHHPLIFKGVKKITAASAIERCIIRAIKHDIAVYGAHTNLDSVKGGINASIAQRLGLQHQRILSPKKDQLCKLVVFIPRDHADSFRTVLFHAGAGRIGDYDCCSYNLEGKGTFRGLDGAHPFVGKRGELHTEPETRIEVLFPTYITGRIEQAIEKNHPYEKPAYDIYPLNNTCEEAGLGMVGVLPEALSEEDFLSMCKRVFGTGCIRHSPFTQRRIERVALCGGSGAAFMEKAVYASAQAFVTADVKYDQFFSAQDDRILLVDVGHYESEYIGMEILFEAMKKDFSDMPIRLTNISTNPVRYYRQ